MMKTANLLDFSIIAIYMAAMLSVGFVFMRFNRDASDYFKGGNRIPWLVAGLSCFMSGFSAWTFTGAAGIAYRNGIVVVLLYVGNAVSFLLGYFVFARRWRRSRVTTTMGYLDERFNEGTRQTFSVVSVFFQLFMAASVLYGLGLLIASSCGVPLVGTIVVCGLIVLVYSALGGLWAVVVTDFLQAVILMPFCLVLLGASLIRVGGLSGLYHALPAGMVSLRLPSQYGWLYVVAWSLMVSVGYNTSAMAQRYFSVDDERSAKRVALLCFGLFLLGAFIWFIPPMAMRVIYPDLAAIMPSFSNAHEAAFAAASLTLLPNGLIGIMLAAMFSSAMASLSGTFNMHAGIISKDVYQTLFAKTSSDSALLKVGRITTVIVASTITLLAVVLAVEGKSIFQVMVTFNTIISLAYGPPALLGLLVKKTPPWSGLVSFLAGLGIGSVGSFLLGWGLVMNVVVVVPVSITIFLCSRWFDRPEGAHVVRREKLFARLNTPVDVQRELADCPDQTVTVFRFLSRITGGVGVLTLMLLFFVARADRPIVISYATITLLIAFSLKFIRGKQPIPAEEHEVRKEIEIHDHA
jgi:SSS family solute:Na+ symporter